MKPRDLAIVGAVVLIGGFAAFDAVRGGGGEGSVAEPPAARATTSDGSEETTTSPTVSLPGRLIYTDEGCHVREIELGTDTGGGRRVADGACGLWGAPGGGGIAYGVGPVERRFYRFRVTDLDERARDYGPYRALQRSIVWRADGSALAWCDDRRRGWELVLGNEQPVRLPECPVAYTRSGEPAFLRGRNLLLGRARIPVRPDELGRISAVSFGNDGSLAVVVRDEILRYGSIDSPVALARVSLRDPYRDSPVFAPDNCAALLRSPHTGQPPTVTIISLGCERRVDRRVVPGNEVAWSPDGEWFAVAEPGPPGTISFYTPAGATAPVVVSAHANQLIWKEPR